MAEDKKKKSESKEEKKKQEAIDFEELVSKMKLSLLRELLEGNNVKLTKNVAKKRAVEEFVELAMKRGTRIFMDSLDKETMKTVLEELKVDVDHDSKTRFLKDFKKKFDEAKSPIDFFSSLSRKSLNKICEALGFALEEDVKKEDVEDSLQDEILASGATKCLDNLNKEFVVDVAKDLDLPATGSKKGLINRILGQSFPHLAEEEHEEKKEKKKKKEDVEKPEIKKGITKDELYQHYSKDLQSFCKENNLKLSGTKKEVIVRILKFLDGDIESTRQLTPAERKAKKEEKKKKATEARKKAAEERKKKRAAEKKEEEKEEKEEKKKEEPKKRGRKRKADTKESDAKKKKSS